MRKRRKFVISAVVLLLLAGTLTVVWKVCDWPPPRLILKYGFPPTGGPTGRTKVIEGIEFVELKPGYFRMGSHHHCTEGDLLGRVSAVFGLTLGTRTEHEGYCCPTRWVELHSPFWIAATEVTNSSLERSDLDYERVTEGDRHPAIYVSYLDAAAFCRWLSSKHRGRFRIPREAEWEFACRAGTDTIWSHGDNEQELLDFAWIEPNSRMKAHPVMMRRPNPWGLFDMHGNVNEWCSDRWDRLKGEAAQASRVVRGGCYYYYAAWCSSADRGRCDEAKRQDNLGFRPVFTLPEDE